MGGGSGVSTQLRTSATCVSCVISFKASMKRAQRFASPFIPKLSMPPVPAGIYFFAKEK